MNRSLIAFAGILGGLALSFLGLGLLWIGLPWYVQALWGFPFLLLCFGLGKGLGSFPRAFIFPALGAMPIAGLLARFRDPSGSHLYPILIVCAWGAGCLIGAWLGTKPDSSPRTGGTG